MISETLKHEYKNAGIDAVEDARFVLIASQGHGRNTS